MEQVVCQGQIEAVTDNRTSIDVNFSVHLPRAGAVQQLLSVY